MQDERVASPEQCLESIDSLRISLQSEAKLILVGSGGKFLDISKASVCDESLVPNAYDTACLALAAYTEGELIEPLRAEPSYIRNEVSWKKRQRIRSQ